MRHAVVFVLVAIAAATLAQPATAEEDHWIARVRALGALADSHSDPIADTGTRVGVDNAFGGEVSVTYLLDPHWGIELSAATTPLKLSTTGGQFPGLDAGRANLVSGMLSFEYRFATHGKVRPYLGIGMAFARPTGYTLSKDMEASNIANLTFTNSLRVHTQVGADVLIGKGWRLDLDLRYVPVTTRVDFRQNTGGSLDTIALSINPILVGVGIGRTF